MAVVFANVYCEKVDEKLEVYGTFTNNGDTVELASRAI